MADTRCPRCFSRISDFVTGEEALWTDDPIKTPKGEAGELYKGFTYITPTHIEEIQQIRQQQEIDVGILEENRTVFTPVRVEGERVYFYKKHLRELRESTEKILEASGQSKDSYFNYDEEETEYNIGNHQLDWHDVDLTLKFLDIKAVHIEDLRHYLLTGWYDDFTNITPTKSGSGSAHSYADIRPYYYSYTPEYAYFSHEAIDDKTDKLQIGNTVYTHSDWGLGTGSHAEEGDGANGRSSFSINVDKPITINLSSSADAEIDTTGCDDTVYGFGSNTCYIRWIADYFKNPSPKPRIQVTQNRKIYLEISNLSYNFSGTYNDFSQSHDNSSNGYIKVVIPLYDDMGGYYNLEYYLAPAFTDTNGKTTYILQNGRNELTMPESLFATGQPIYYFCNYIDLTIYTSAYAGVDGVDSKASSSILNFTLNKIGI